MTFTTTDSEVLLLLGEHAGVGLWDCIIADGDPYAAATRWCWSPEFRRLLGFADPRDFPNVLDALLQRFHPDELAMVLEVFDSTIADAAPVAHYDMKFRLRCADDGYRWFRSIGNIKHDAEGRATRACGSLIDIHDGEMAVAALKQQSERDYSRMADAHAAAQQRFYQIAATSVDSIVCTDEDGIVTFWNQRSAEWLGIPAGAIIGRHLDMVMPARFRGRDDFCRRHLSLVGNVREFECIDAAGRTIPVEVSVSTWLEGGRHCFGLISRDLTKRKAQEAMLVEMALHDSLTGLPNRLAFGERMTALLAETRSFSVLMIDLDGFKSVNDNFGHEAGDLVLRQAAARLSQALPEGGFVARLGGDEFALILAAGETAETVRAFGTSLIAILEQPTPLDGGVVARVSATVGVAFAPQAADDPVTLLRLADLALYRGKRQGRGRVCVHE